MATDRIAWRRPTDADFSDVDFKTYIAVDNLTKGYLQTYDLGLIQQNRQTLCRLRTARSANGELAAVFHWIASVKDFFVKKFPISFLRQIQTHSAGSELYHP